jgi:putative endonuclease
VFQHKNKLAPGFTSRYNLARLVYYEEFVYPGAAINREKEIKGWRRNKKIQLIESMNPHWRDLAESWKDVYKPPALPAKSSDAGTGSGSAECTFGTC